MPTIAIINTGFRLNQEFSAFNQVRQIFLITRQGNLK